MTGNMARHMQNGLDHCLAHLGAQIVELRGVVPGKAGAVIAVIDIARLARPAITRLKHHRRVCAVDSNDLQS